LIDRLQDAGKQGLITGDQMAEGLEKAKQKVDDLQAGVNSLDEAMRDFGLKTRGDLQLTADKLTQAWQQIQNSTTVSLADQRRAFDQWAAAVIAANGGVETEAVKVARAIFEIKEAADKADKGITDNAKTSGAALDDLGARASHAADQVNRLASASASLDKFNARNTSSPNDAKNQIGNGTNGGFGTLANSDGTLSIPDGYAFDQAAYNRALQNYFNGIGSSSTHTTAPNPQDYVVENPQTGGPRKDGSGTDAGTPLFGSKSGTPTFSIGTTAKPASAPAPTPAPAPAPAPTGGSTQSASVHTVNVVINGVQTKVNTSSQADAGSLVSVIKNLESAARSSGTQVRT